MLRLGVGFGFALGASLLFAAPAAQAHFVLVEPESWMSQDGSGNPQKLGPCGDEGGGTATGKVTAFRAGQTITVTINETVFHSEPTASNNGCWRCAGGGGGVAVGRWTGGVRHHR
jgi:hypothetical protein